MPNTTVNLDRTPFRCDAPLQRTLRRVGRTFADIPVWRRGRAG